MKISIVVTNFNGLKIIQKSLPLIIANRGPAHELIFADDASTDASLVYVRQLQKQYPFIKIISHPHNVGFAANSNAAVKAAVGDLVVLLNSDIHPQPGFITACLSHFRDPQVFGVGLCEINNPNWARIFWREGYLQYEPGTKIDQPHISAWVSGGSSIVRRSLFLKLGGFDEIYEPFYSEDLDLGYRAWKSGYKLLWEPKAKVIHKHEATISKFPRRFTDYVKERNRLLTVWRNITDNDLLRSNHIALIFRVLFGPNYIKIILAARRQLKKASPPVVFPQLSDHQIFQLFAHD